MVELIRAELAGLPVLQIAKRTGLPYAVAHGFMRGESDVRASTLQKLAKLAGLELTRCKQRR